MLAAALQSGNTLRSVLNNVLDVVRVESDQVALMISLSLPLPLSMGQKRGGVDEERTDRQTRQYLLSSSSSSSQHHS